MEQKPSAQWRNMHCHIIVNRDLTKEFMARVLPSPHSIACSCGTLFLQVESLMSFGALFRYLCTENLFFSCQILPTYLCKSLLLALFYRKRIIYI